MKGRKPCTRDSSHSEEFDTSEIVLDDVKRVVTIKNLRIENTDFYNFLVDLSEEERGSFVRRALVVGAVALQGMETATRVDYVRKEFQSMQHELDNRIKEVFLEDGQLSRILERFLGENGELKRALDSHFGEKGSVIYNILNPSDESTPLGKFRKQLQQELDADREGTAFSKLKKAMNDGFNQVLVAVHAAEAVEKEREKGTAKGRDFQSYVQETLDSMARDFEDTVEFVGDESGPLGKVGDINVCLNPRDVAGVERKIVVEVKTASITMTGKNSFLKELDRARENRGAQYAIGVVHESRVPEAIGAFRRYSGQKIICRASEEETLPLEIAYKVARAEVVLSCMRKEARFDPSYLKSKVEKIRGQLDIVKAVKRSLTGAEGNIGSARKDLEEMERSIREILNEILDMIKTETRVDTKKLIIES